MPSPKDADNQVFLDIKVVNKVEIVRSLRMIDKTLTASARKKVCTVQTALAKNDETCMSIVKDLLPTKPGSQDVLDVCLMQAFIDMKK